MRLNISTKLFSMTQMKHLFAFLFLVLGFDVFGASVTDLQKFNTAPVMAAYVPTGTNAVILLGTSSPGDGGGGIFYYAIGSVTATNSTTVFAAPYGAATGRWIAATILNLTNKAIVGGTVTGQTNLDLTASRVMVSDSSGRPSSSGVNSTTIGYLDVGSSLTSILSAKVPTSRAVSTTSPLAGGGAFSGDLTLSIPVATSSTDGYLASADWNTFNGKVSATVGSVINSGASTTNSIMVPTDTTGTNVTSTTNLPSAVQSSITKFGGITSGNLIGVTRGQQYLGAGTNVVWDFSLGDAYWPVTGNCRFQLTGVPTGTNVNMVRTLTIPGNAGSDIRDVVDTINFQTSFGTLLGPTNYISVRWNGYGLEGWCDPGSLNVTNISPGSAYQVASVNSGGTAVAFAAVNLAQSAAVTGTLPVVNGGSGVASLTAYAPVFGGTTTTAPVQSGTVGTSGYVLTSNGAGALPTFQASSGSIVGLSQLLWNSSYGKGVARFFAVANGNGTAMASTPGLSLTASGTAAAFAVSSTQMQGVKLTTTASGTAPGLIEAAGGVIWDSRDFTVGFYVSPFDSNGTIASNAFWCGVFSAAPNATTSPAHGCGFRYSPTVVPDTNYVAYSNDANGNTSSRISTVAIVPVSGQPALFVMTKVGTTLTFYHNGTSILTNTWNPTGVEGKIWCASTTDAGASGATRGVVIHMIDGFTSLP